jgi:hypothetical protein
VVTKHGVPFFGGIFGKPMPIATHQLILLANAWQLAQVGRNGHQKTFARAAMQGCLAPPLSLVDNKKNYFINNTH